MSSDEEDDITQLQTVEHKLLTHDPTFGIEQTHAALTSQRSAFMSAFRPQYIDGDVEGMTSRLPLPMYRAQWNWQFMAFHRRSRADPFEHRALASLRNLVRAQYGRRRQRRTRRSPPECPRIFLYGRPRTSRPGTLPRPLLSVLVLQMLTHPHHRRHTRTCS